MSIALASFSLGPVGRVIFGVQTIAETRRQRLQMLLKQHGSIAALNDLIGLARTDATLSQVRNRSPHHKTGKPRAMGDDLARKIEEALDLPEGWMDTPPTHTELHGAPSTADLITQVVLCMEPEQQYAALRVVHALSQPAAGQASEQNGTTG
jgi:hypothetical protein